MTLIIYVDVLLVVNLIVTYFLLTASAIITGYTYNIKRIIFSSVFGAVFCLYIFVQSNSVAVDITVKISSLVVCAAVAFWNGKLRSFVSQSICFLLLNFLLAGIVIWISIKNSLIYHNNFIFYYDINPVILVLSSVFIYAVITVFAVMKEHFCDDKLYSVDMIFKKFCVYNINAFYDSGLKIKDIISNKDVMIVGYDDVKTILPKDLSNDIKSFFEEKYQTITTDFIPVFYNTVSSHGMLPSLKTEMVVINNKTIKNVLVAFAQNKLDDNVSALFGTAIKKQL